MKPYTGDTLEWLFTDEILEMTLITDMRKLMKEKYKDEYQDGTLVIITNEGKKSVDIKLKARGNFRKKYCHFPPLRLNFADSEFESKAMGQYLTKLKLVTHCRAQSLMEQYILQEYLAYKIFNILTEKSFKVRLLKLTYEDIQQKVKPITRCGFFIEDASRLAERLDGILLNRQKIHQTLMDSEYMKLVAVFQYMIGNTDWSVPALHNIKLIKTNDPTKMTLYCIPYDFDYSGIVNASYAIPAEQLGIRSVTERIYRGFCYPAEALSATFTIFNEKKEAIYELYQNFYLLEDRYKKSSLTYLDQFYKVINNPKLVEKEFVRSCRTE